MGYKRGHLLRRRDGSFATAGAYTRAVVPLTATSPPGEPGFSAHVGACDAHRYRPTRLPLLTVGLGDLVAVFPYLRAGRQRVAAAALNALCSTRGCRERADYAWVPTNRFGGRVAAELAGTCGDYREPGGAPANLDDLRRAGLAVRELGLQLSSFVRRYELATPRRACPCRAVDEVTERSGLRLYFQTLWDLDASVQLGDGTWRMRCWECGAWWRYDRAHAAGRRETPPEGATPAGRAPRR